MAHLVLRLLMAKPRTGTRKPRERPERLSEDMTGCAEKDRVNAGLEERKEAFDSREESPLLLRPLPEERRATFWAAWDCFSAGRPVPLDDTLLLRFDAPRSFTGTLSALPQHRSREEPTISAKDGPSMGAYLAGIAGKSRSVSLDFVTSRDCHHSETD